MTPSPVLETPAKTPGRAGPLVHLSRDFIRAKEYLEAIVASSSDAICTTDTNGRIIYFSPGAEAMLGISSARIMGRAAHETYAGGREEARRLMRKLRKTGSIQNHEMILKAGNGRRIHVSMSASLLRDRSGRVIGTLGISKDITPRVELERRLRALSITDNLTGLYNQRHFRERLAQEASRARRQGEKLSLVLMDLDGFKQVNDRKGHLAGDRLLKAFSGVLLQSIRREVDSAYRYGGDEFVVLLPGLGRERAERVARRLASAARARLRRRGIRFSYGVSNLPKAGSLADFIQEADRRMFRMKAKRKGPGSRA